MKKRTQITWGAIFILLIAVYLGLWQYSAAWFKKEIDYLYTHAQDDGVKFLGPKPVLSNFPFVPKVTYTGGVQFGNAMLLFPTLTIHGYPLPSTSLNISFPEGVQLAGIVNPVIWSLDSLDAKLGIPYHLPRTLNASDITKWQSKGGKIDIRDYELRKHALYSHGSGMFAFDEDLQPVFFLDSGVQGYEEFIADQKEQGLIDPFAAAVGITILNGLASHDDASGNREVSLSVSVKNRILTVGPLQVLELPQIVWDTHTQPVPHQ